MKIDIVNFARHDTKKQLRWFVGRQLPLWIQEMVRRKAQGDDPGQLIDELADVCCVTLDTKPLD
jgi:hypothetical protein